MYTEETIVQKDVKFCERYNKKMEICLSEKKVQNIAIRSHF